MKQRQTPLPASQPLKSELRTSIKPNLVANVCVHTTSYLLKYLPGQVASVITGKQEALRKKYLGNQVQEPPIGVGLRESPQINLI